MVGNMAGTDFLFSLAYVFVPRGPGGDFRGLGVPWGGGRGPWDPKITISAVGAYLTSNGFLAKGRCTSLDI